MIADHIRTSQQNTKDENQMPNNHVSPSDILGTLETKLIALRRWENFQLLISLMPQIKQPGH
jgi:hypothetical protein